MNWFTVGMTFIAVNLDFFFILIILLHKYHLQAVIIGYLAGIITLVTASFVAGKFLAAFLPEWVLGILGICPIWVALHDHDDDPNTKKQTGHHAWLKVMLTYLSVCTGCNLSLFLPLLSSISILQFVETLLLLTLLTILLVCLLQVIGDLPMVNYLMNKYGENLTKIIYVGVGTYVFFDSGLVSHLGTLI